MDYLELCKRTRQEAGIAGTGPSSVLNQTGELKRVVDWVAAAYSLICAKHESWKFLRSSFSVNTVAGTEAYAPTSCTDTEFSVAVGSPTVGDFARWMPDTFRIYLQSAGVGTRQYFWPLDYDWFRDKYQLQPPANGQPAEFSIRPRDSAILVGPKPSAVYVISGDYYRAAPPLAADADSPIFPARFHMAIAYLAERLYAGYEEDGGVWMDANSNFGQYYFPLMVDQLPQIGLGGPLA